MYLRSFIAYAVFFCGIAHGGIALHTDPDPVLVADTLKVTSVLDGSETVNGFQLELLIIPDIGATGTVAFDTVTKPVTDYFLGNAGTSFFKAVSTTNTLGDSLLVLDNTAGSGFSLVGGEIFADLTFTSSVGATGTFGLYAIDKPGQTEPMVLAKRTNWLDTEGATIQFTNVDRGTVSVPIQTRIGTIAIPEPSALLYMFVCVTLVGAVRRVTCGYRKRYSGRIGRR